MITKHNIGLLLLFSALITACNSNKKDPENKGLPKFISNDTANTLTFKDVEGVRFYEVKRRFNNGLSFNKDGFQQEPSWIIQYQYPDTMLAYSPEKGGMEHFYLQFDHGRVYNFAKEFFRAILITKDSLVLQRLQVEAQIVKNDVRSDVYCIYYTKDYIEKKLKTTIAELQKTTKRDTAFIADLIKKSEKHPESDSLAFAARQPVQFIPKSKNVTVEKIDNYDDIRNKKVFEYMYPEYRLEIKKSYKAFAYRFSVIVTTDGRLIVNRVEGVMEDDVPYRKRLLQGIVDVYVKNLYKIIPGKTLDMPHSSEITLNVVGKLAK
jgi:hypothetical protein